MTSANAVLVGHTRLCAGCNKVFYLDYPPSREECRPGGPPAWFCKKCRERRQHER
jgi:hypothetical protein